MIFIIGRLVGISKRNIPLFNKYFDIKLESQKYIIYLKNTQNSSQKYINYITNNYKKKKNL